MESNYLPSELNELFGICSGVLEFETGLQADSTPNVSTSILPEHKLTNRQTYLNIAKQIANKDYNSIPKLYGSYTPVVLTAALISELSNFYETHLPDVWYV